MKPLSLRVLLVGAVIFGIGCDISAKELRSHSTRTDAEKPAASSDCQQRATERNRLMAQAEKKTFTVRRVEFIGLTYTHDHVVRNRMTPFVQEGDIFSRNKLVQSLQNISRLKRSLYPLRLRDVVIELNTSEKTVDMILCFKQKPR